MSTAGSAAYIDARKQEMVFLLPGEGAGVVVVGNSAAAGAGEATVCCIMRAARRSWGVGLG
jgi:uncharacterized 2Fe-2S/4Fe-4S cluster protein (DUF4445 family)